MFFSFFCAYLLLTGWCEKWYTQDKVHARDNLSHNAPRLHSRCKSKNFTILMWIGKTLPLHASRMMWMQQPPTQMHFCKMRCEIPYTTFDVSPRSERKWIGSGTVTWVHTYIKYECAPWCDIFTNKKNEEAVKDSANAKTVLNWLGFEEFNIQNSTSTSSIATYQVYCLLYFICYQSFRYIFLVDFMYPSA